MLRAPEPLAVRVRSSDMGQHCQRGAPWGALLTTGRSSEQPCQNQSSRSRAAQETACQVMGWAHQPAGNGMGPPILLASLRSRQTPYRGNALDHMRHGLFHKGTHDRWGARHKREARRERTKK